MITDEMKRECGEILKMAGCKSTSAKGHYIIVAYYVGKFGLNDLPPAASIMLTCGRASELVITG